MEQEAYAKLQGPKFTAYLTEPSMTLGRAKDTKGHIYLSDDPKISKRHASIDWNSETSAFYIKCVGRNSMVVNQAKINADDEAVKLESRTAVRIGSVEFYFLLPL